MNCRGAAKEANAAEGLRLAAGAPPGLLRCDGLTYPRHRQIRPECFVSQPCCLSPGLQERAKGFTVGDIDKEPADPDPDLALAWTGQRDDELDMDVLSSGGHHLCRAVEMWPARRSWCPIRGIGYCS